MQILTRERPVRFVKTALPKPASLTFTFENASNATKMIPPSLLQWTHSESIHASNAQLAALEAARPSQPFEAGANGLRANSLVPYDHKEGNTRNNEMPMGEAMAIGSGWLIDWDGSAEMFFPDEVWRNSVWYGSGTGTADGYGDNPPSGG